MGKDTSIVRAVLNQVKANGRTVLTATEAKQVCEAYSIPLPNEGIATSATEASSIAESWSHGIRL